MHFNINTIFDRLEQFDLLSWYPNSAIDHLSDCTCKVLPISVVNSHKFAMIGRLDVTAPTPNGVYRMADWYNLNCIKAVTSVCPLVYRIAAKVMLLRILVNAPRGLFMFGSSDKKF